MRAIIAKPDTIAATTAIPQPAPSDLYAAFGTWKYDRRIRWCISQYISSEAEWISRIANDRYVVQ